MNKINWLIIIFTLSYFLWFLNSDFVISYLAFSKINLLNGRIWTLITSLFVHDGILHLMGNMIFLYIFGNTLEKELKPIKTLFAFFIGGIISFLLSTFFFDPSTTMVGSSAAIFTLISIVMLVKPLELSFFFPIPLGLLAIIYFLYNVSAVYYGIGGNIAYISHIIGFSTGILFGIVWSKNWLKNLLITFLLLILYLLIQIYVIPLIFQ